MDIGCVVWTTPWLCADVVEEIMDLAKDVIISFVHVRRRANLAADLLAKNGVWH